MLWVLRTLNPQNIPQDCPSGPIDMLCLYFWEGASSYVVMQYVTQPQTWLCTYPSVDPAFLELSHTGGPPPQIRLSSQVQWSRVFLAHSAMFIIIIMIIMTWFMIQLWDYYLRVWLTGSAPSWRISADSWRRTNLWLDGPCKRSWKKWEKSTIRDIRWHKVNHRLLRCQRGLSAVC